MTSVFARGLTRGWCYSHASPTDPLAHIAAMPDGPDKPRAETIEHARRLLSWLRPDVPAPQIIALDGYVYFQWGSMMVQVDHDG